MPNSPSSVTTMRRLPLRSLALEIGKGAVGAAVASKAAATTADGVAPTGSETPLDGAAAGGDGALASTRGRSTVVSSSGGLGCGAPRAARSAAAKARAPA